MGPTIQAIPLADCLPRFNALSAAVYKNDPLYCHPFPDSLIASLNRIEFAGRQTVLGAFRNDSLCARLAARLSPSLTDDRGKPLGMLGFFEALDDPSLTKPLFDEAIRWLRDRGAGRIVGPMDGDTWHAYRLNAGPLLYPPFLMEPYNPDYYASLWEQAGFRILESYYSTTLLDFPAALAKNASAASRAESLGYSLRPFAPDRFTEELDRIYDLTCAIFRNNFLYTEIGRAEFHSLYQGTRFWLDPDLISFALDKSGREIGFLFSFPDVIGAVRAMRGSRSWPARLHFLLRKGRTRTVNIKTIGVLPEHQGKGLSYALVNRIYHTLLKKGYNRANLCLFKEGNRSGALDGGAGVPLRRYHLYHYDS